MKMKKVLAIVVSMVLCCTALVGCGGSAGYTSENKEFVIGVF